MLWKPSAPIYPNLIQEAPEGLTKEEAKELRLQGESLLPICRLAKNGIFLSLVEDVRDAFELSNLVKVNCERLERNDHKKIGAKLKDLVPCVLLSFDNEQILMWRGKTWKSRYSKPFSLVPKVSTKDGEKSSYSVMTDDDKGESTDNKVSSSFVMASLWKRALESNRALLLDDTELSPDSLLDKVEGFEGLSLAAGADAFKISEADCSDITETESDVGEVEDEDGEEDDEDDCYEELESSIVPFGSLPVDFLAEKLHREI